MVLTPFLAQADVQYRQLTSSSQCEDQMQCLIVSNQSGEAAGPMNSDGALQGIPVDGLSQDSEVIPNVSGAQVFTFHADTSLAGNYYISTEVDGSTYYLYAKATGEFVNNTVEYILTLSASRPYDSWTLTFSEGNATIRNNFRSNSREQLRFSPSADAFMAVSNPPSSMLPIQLYRQEEFTSTDPQFLDVYFVYSQGDGNVGKVLLREDGDSSGIYLGEWTPTTTDSYKVWFEYYDTAAGMTLRCEPVLGEDMPVAQLPSDTFLTYAWKVGNASWIIDSDTWAQPGQPVKVAVNLKAGVVGFGGDIQTEVSPILNGSQDESARWFTLQGVEVRTPEKGLYIRVHNDDVTKVLVK